MSAEQQAAQNLINQAMQSRESSMFTLLIESAHRIDNSVNVKEYESKWVEKWIQSEYTKRNVTL